MSDPSRRAGAPQEATDEAELLERLRAGDDAAYETLVTEHGGRLLAVARRILGNEEDARDALQEGFLSAFKAIDRFEGQSKLGTWLHRIIVNSALMRLRSRKRRDEKEIDEMLPEFTPGGHFRETPQRWSEAADVPAQRREVREVVLRAIESLPDNYRIPLLLRDIEGLTNDEVAERLDVTVNAAKIRVHRARLALRNLLDPSMRD